MVVHFSSLFPGACVALTIPRSATQRGDRCNVWGGHAKRPRLAPLHDDGYSEHADCAAFDGARRGRVAACSSGADHHDKDIETGIDVFPDVNGKARPSICAKNQGL